MNMAYFAKLATKSCPFTMHPLHGPIIVADRLYASCSSRFAQKAKSYPAPTSLDENVSSTEVSPKIKHAQNMPSLLKTIAQSSKYGQTTSTKTVFRSGANTSVQTSQSALKSSPKVPKSYDGESREFKYTKNAAESKIKNSYFDYSREEMALLTTKEESLPLVEAILNCPMELGGWGQVSQAQRSLLRKISEIYSSDRLPSITRILGHTRSPMDDIVLNKWKKKKIEELGEEGFSAHMKKLTDEGHAFHDSILAFLSNMPVEIRQSGQWKSVISMLERLGDVNCLETSFSHPLLSYHGKLDCVAEFENNLCVFDWKLSSSRKTTLKKCYDDPYQVAAYAGAFNISENLSTQVSNAVIVKAYRDGSPADVHIMNDVVLDFYWNGWLRRLARYHMLNYNSIYVD